MRKAHIFAGLLNVFHMSGVGSSVPTPEITCTHCHGASLLDERSAVQTSGLGELFTPLRTFRSRTLTAVEARAAKVVVIVIVVVGVALTL